MITLPIWLFVVMFINLIINAISNTYWLLKRLGYIRG